MAGFWSIIVPEATTNLVTNPSIGIDTTGFTAVGGSIARNTGAQKREVASLKITPTSGVNDGVYYGTVSLTNGQSYTFSVDIKGTDGEPYTIYFANTGGTKQGSSTDFNAIGDWERQEVTWACDSTASYRLYVTKDNDNNTGDFYVDGLQCENLAYSTTYIDGNQEGGKWAGDEHTSASERDAQSRLGGRLYNLDDYGFYIDDMPGIGMPPILHQTQEQPMLSGSLLRGFKTKPRVFDLIANQIGTTHEDLHSKRKDLLNAIKPDLVLEPQPFILRYTGANSEKPIEIRCVYDSGYQFTKLDGFVERQLPLRFISYDEPYFYEIGNVAKVLSATANITVQSFIAKIDNTWTVLGTSDSGAVTIDALRDGNYLYIGGNFLNWDGIANADHIVRYDFTTATWEAMGTGGQARVNEMILDADGNLYVTGAFTSMGGVSNTAYIAMWDGDSWNALGTGLNEEGFTLVADFSGNVYVGGVFTSAGGISDTAYFAKWNGSVWSSVGIFNALVVSSVLAKNGHLFIGGSFTQIDADSTINRIVDFDGTNFTALGSGLSHICRAIAVNDNGDVYAGGDFTTAGGTAVNRVAMWNSAVWAALGSGANNNVFTMSINRGLLYIGGLFTEIDNISIADRVAVWNGYTWSRLDIELPGSPTVYLVKIIDGDLYLGWYDGAGTANVSYLNTVTNNGTRSAYPKIVIKRSGGTSAVVAWMKNETTGATLFLDYPLLDGETLIIDLSEGDRSIVSSLHGDVWQANLRASNFADFYLLPKVNYVSMLVNEVDSSTITVSMQWRNTHWSADGVAP